VRECEAPLGEPEDEAIEVVERTGQEASHRGRSRLSAYQPVEWIGFLIPLRTLLGIGDSHDGSAFHLLYMVSPVGQLLALRLLLLVSSPAEHSPFRPSSLQAFYATKTGAKLEAADLSWGRSWVLDWGYADFGEFLFHELR